MVKVLNQHMYYPYDWATFTQAIWQKYPNPFASHVLTADVIESKVDPQTGILYRTRLFLKSGIIPKWGRALMSVPEAFIIEHTMVDPSSQKMVVVQKNLSHTKLMLVEERQTIVPDNSTVAAQTTTMVHQEGRIVSSTGWNAVKARIEGFGLSNFKKNTIKSSKGLLHVLEQLAGSNNTAKTS
ncbi:PRELI-like family-domain-containing protein [Cladochytrium replicatum]|nr:PRELI-like family-domain-containing protein [Cladochytrium replicatum]